MLTSAFGHRVTGSTVTTAVVVSASKQAKESFHSILRNKLRMHGLGTELAVAGASISSTVYAGAGESESWETQNSPTAGF